MPTTTPTLEFKAFFLPHVLLTREQISDIVEGKTFVHFWGLIKYRDAFFDVFPKERKTSFRYVWEYSALYGDSSNRDEPPFGSWHKKGQPDENEET
jgi:hypothetical protein